MTPTLLLLLTAGSIALLLALIMILRIHAFIALLVVSMAAALLGGIPAGEVIDTIQTGMGRTLGYIAVVIGIGTMLGEIIQVSGGAQVIARTLLRSFGEQRAPWALSLIGLIVAIPVFFEVALILFIPLVYDLTRKTGRSILYYGLPLVGGIAVAHAFIPPTPGPVAVASLLGADLGWVIFIGILAGIPSAIAGGVLYGTWIGKRIVRPVPDYMETRASDMEPEAGIELLKPLFSTVIALIALPLVMILSNTASTVLLPEGHLLRDWLSFLGHPFTALIVATLLAFWLLGTRLGFSRKQIHSIAARSMEPVGMIILVTGAGGVFGQVLIATGVGDELVRWMEHSNLPVILFAFLIATVLRVSQGSATVAMVTSAGLLAPIVTASSLSGPMLGCVVIAVACGSTVLSHVNDSGFWLVNQFMGLTEEETLRSWTVMETVIGCTGLLALLVISLFL
ncbi:MAG: GntP family permease [Bacteroidota bacterium]